MCFMREANFSGGANMCGSADAARLAGSRWHVISEAARHGRVLVVQP